jgi:hypothetical protein
MKRVCPENHEPFSVSYYFRSCKLHAYVQRILSFVKGANGK